MKKAVGVLLEIISGAWLFRFIYGLGEAISPSGMALIHLRYRKGKCSCLSGTVLHWTKSQIEEILNEGNVQQAVIKQMKDGRFTFSKSIPDEIRQPIRNILTSR